MKREEFLKKGIVALGGVVALTGIAASNSKNDEVVNEPLDDCEVSPKETRGPFPNKTPSDYVRENIIGDRKGVALLMTLTILNINDDCKPLANTPVDVWHCDSQGNYSEYSGFGMRQDMTEKHFLRGRQTTDANGRVSFVSIFPGHYRGRAPHIHVEVLGKTNKSLLVTQIAFPEKTCNTVYVTENYQGTDYVSNARDGIFRDSLEQNMADALTGSVQEGYTLLKTIVVNA